MALAIITLLALGGFLLWLAGRGRERSGVPAGRLIYTDTGGWRRPEHPLFSDRYRLTGKPDYLVEEDGVVVPVEVKSGRAPAQPYDSHVLQLAAYCLLVEERYGQRPERGIIKYADRTFAVDYTPALEEALLATMDQMRDDLTAGGAVRSHDEPRRCRACGHRQQCDQRLA
jgi:CRISPR-associated exonuclease Cas4